MIQVFNKISPNRPPPPLLTSRCSSQHSSSRGIEDFSRGHTYRNSREVSPITPSADNVNSMGMQQTPQMSRSQSTFLNAAAGSMTANSGTQRGALGQAASCAQLAVGSSIAKSRSGMQGAGSSRVPNRLELVKSRTEMPLREVLRPTAMAAAEMQNRSHSFKSNVSGKNIESLRSTLHTLKQNLNAMKTGNDIVKNGQEGVQLQKLDNQIDKSEKPYQSKTAVTKRVLGNKFSDLAEANRSRVTELDTSHEAHKIESKFINTDEKADEIKINRATKMPLHNSNIDQVAIVPGTISSYYITGQSKSESGVYGATKDDQGIGPNRESLKPSKSQNTMLSNNSPFGRAKDTLNKLSDKNQKSTSRQYDSQSDKAANVGQFGKQSSEMQNRCNLNDIKNGLGGTSNFEEVANNPKYFSELISMANVRQILDTNCLPSDQNHHLLTNEFINNQSKFLNPADGKTLSFNNTRDTSIQKLLNETKSNNQLGQSIAFAQLINNTSLAGPLFDSNCGSAVNNTAVKEVNESSYNGQKQFLVTQVLDNDFLKQSNVIDSGFKINKLISDCTSVKDSEFAQKLHDKKFQRDETQDGSRNGTKLINQIEKLARNAIQCGDVSRQTKTVGTSNQIPFGILSKVSEKPQISDKFQIKSLSSTQALQALIPNDYNTSSTLAKKRHTYNHAAVCNSRQQESLPSRANTTASYNRWQGMDGRGQQALDKGRSGEGSGLQGHENWVGGSSYEMSPLVSRLNERKSQSYDRVLVDGEEEKGLNSQDEEEKCARIVKKVMDVLQLKGIVPMDKIDQGKQIIALRNQVNQGTNDQFNKSNELQIPDKIQFNGSKESVRTKKSRDDLPESVRIEIIQMEEDLEFQRKRNQCLTQKLEEMSKMQQRATELEDMNQQLKDKVRLFAELETTIREKAELQVALIQEKLSKQIETNEDLAIKLDASESQNKLLQSHLQQCLTQLDNTHLKQSIQKPIHPASSTSVICTSNHNSSSTLNPNHLQRRHPLLNPNSSTCNTAVDFVNETPVCDDYVDRRALNKDSTPISSYYRKKKIGTRAESVPEMERQEAQNINFQTQIADNSYNFKQDQSVQYYQNEQQRICEEDLIETNKLGLLRPNSNSKSQAVLKDGLTFENQQQMIDQANSSNKNQNNINQNQFNRNQTFDMPLQMNNSSIPHPRDSSSIGQNMPVQMMNGAINQTNFDFEGFGEGVSSQAIGVYQQDLTAQSCQFEETFQESTSRDELRQKLYETMEMSPDKVSIEDLLKRLSKEHKFSVKIIKLVRDTEDYEESKSLSLADCWRWIKGLLYDFVRLKQNFEKTNQALIKAEKVIVKYTEDLTIVRQGYKNLEAKAAKNKQNKIKTGSKVRGGGETGNCQNSGVNTLSKDDINLFGKQLCALPDKRLNHNYAPLNTQSSRTSAPQAIKPSSPRNNSRLGHRDTQEQKHMRHGSGNRNIFNDSMLNNDTDFEHHQSRNGMIMGETSIQSTSHQLLGSSSNTCPTGSGKSHIISNRVHHVNLENKDLVRRGVQRGPDEQKCQFQNDFANKELKELNKTIKQIQCQIQKSEEHQKQFNHGITTQQILNQQYSSFADSSITGTKDIRSTKDAAYQQDPMSNYVNY